MSYDKAFARLNQIETDAVASSWKTLVSVASKTNISAI
jgi:hypothetical protein